MQIYVMTENVFLFKGIVECFANSNEVSVSLINFEQLKNLSDNNGILNDDVFLLSLIEFSHTLASMMILNTHNRRMLFIPYDKKTKVTASFFHKIELNEHLSKEELKVGIFNTGKDKKDRNALGRLTKQQLTILGYLLQGISISEISKRLKINYKTAYFHQRAALDKIGVKKIAHLSNVPVNNMIRLSAKAFP